MKAILIAPISNSDAVLPPMDSEDETHLTYLVDGVRTGGFSLVGNAPMPDTFTCLVLLHTAASTIDAMAASGDYVFVEEIDAPEIGALAGPNPPRELPEPAALRIWLIQQGYSPSLVAGTIPNDANEILAGLQELHKVSEVEYERARN